MKHSRFLCGICIALVTLSAAFAAGTDNSSGNDSQGLMQELGSDFGTMGQDVNDSFSQIATNLSLQMKTNTQMLQTVFIILAVIGFVMLFLIAFMVMQTVFNMHAQKMQQEQFNSVLTLIRELQNATFKQGLPSGSMLNALPDIDANQAELHALAEQCEQLGEKIDKHTNRINNSKNVSELAFKISQKIGVDRNTMMIYFCASMVYDAGFLSIPADFFMVDILSAKERAQMKKHVEFADSYLSFIPKKYQPVFLDAAMKHHENMNGTGYPQGLPGEEIPQIARLIHVVESYVSLVSRRSYHKIRDKDSAIAELRRQPGVYDSEIVDTLEKVL